MNFSLHKILSKSGVAYHREGIGRDGDESSGVPILLIHGVGLCAESWLPLVEKLRGNFDVIAIDLPGHGQSPALTQTIGSVCLSDYLRKITQFAEELSLDRFIVCGHSLGALIAIEMAATNPHVAGLAALNAIYQRSDTAVRAVQQRALELYNSDTIIGVEQTVNRWFTSSPCSSMQVYADQCVDWLGSNTLSGYALAYKTFADQTGPSANLLATITCPTIYMTGALDLNSSTAMTKALTYDTVNADFLVVNDAAHMLPLTHSEMVCGQLKNLSQRVLLDISDEHKNLIGTGL